MSHRSSVSWKLAATVVAGAVAGLSGATGLLQASRAPLPHVTRVEAHPMLPSGEHRFGDLIEGRLDILVPLAEVDLRTVSATVDLAPYRRVGPLHVERLRAGATGRVRYLFAIDCLESDECVPRPDHVAFTFAGSAVRYQTRDGVARTFTVYWPALHVRPRPRPDILTPWKDGIRPLPTPGFWASPHAVAVLVGLLSFLAMGGAAALLRPLVRYQGSSGQRQLTALELALATVRAAAARRDVDERRRALDLLSRAVRAGTGRRSAEARQLAWSQARPRSRAMHELADRVEQG